MKKQVLIVGGSSGLGLELARIFADHHEVFITGRHDPDEPDVTFIPVQLASPAIGSLFDTLLEQVSDIDLLVYAAGFYQEGRIDELSDFDIERMTQVGLTAPAMLLQRVLSKQDKLPGFIAITSTSQWTPRLLEPMYTAAKAGLAMLAHSVSLDDRVGKVLVAGPSGMKTPFWKEYPRDTSDMLDPQWVAEQIVDLWSGKFEYKFARILREPARVEVVETR